VKKLTLAVIAFASIVTANLAQAADVSCNQIKDVPAAIEAEGWKLTGIRRPAIETGVTTMSVQVYMAPDLARNNIDVKGKIAQIDLCKQANGRFFVGYKVLTVRQDGFDVTEIPLPPKASGAKIMSCSPSTKQCWETVFDGDSGNWVTLKPQPTASAMVGQYK
jgi:hypothetical protein